MTECTIRLQRGTTCTKKQGTERLSAMGALKSKQKEKGLSTMTMTKNNWHKRTTTRRRRIRDTSPEAMRKIATKLQPTAIIVDYKRGLILTPDTAHYLDYKYKRA